MLAGTFIRRNFISELPKAGVQTPVLAPAGDARALSAVRMVMALTPWGVGVGMDGTVAGVGGRMIVLLALPPALPLVAPATIPGTGPSIQPLAL